MDVKKEGKLVGRARVEYKYVLSMPIFILYANVNNVGGDAKVCMGMAAKDVQTVMNFNNAKNKGIATSLWQVSMDVAKLIIYNQQTTILKAQSHNGIINTVDSVQFGQLSKYAINMLDNK